MDYKEKYEMALERAKKLKENPQMVFYEYSPKEGDTICDYIFPELKESKDEKIRKAIIEGLKAMKSNFHTISSIKIDDAINWLEKQKGCEYIKKDWLEHVKQSWYKEGFIDGKYSNKTPKEWTINDATTLNLENGTAKLQHDLTLYANWLKTQFPTNEKQGEQKPAWSEEDEVYLNTTIAYLKDAQEFKKTAENCIGWLKSLKNRVLPQPKQQWSEEDDNDAWMNDIISKVENNLQLNKAEIDWLKSLKPQSQQKWDEEDEKMFISLKTLLNNASCYSCTEGVDKILVWLKQKIGGE